MARRKGEIIALLRAEIVGADPDKIPTAVDFKRQWALLDVHQQTILKVALRCDNYIEMREIMNLTSQAMSNVLRMPPVMKAFYYATVCKLATQKAKKVFIESLMTNAHARTLYQEDVDRIVMTDKDHLIELANQLETDGDGKRMILKQLIAFGMQTKVITPEVIDEKGKRIAEAVVDVADGRMVMSAMTEMNKMDNEYGSDDKATSSIESQANKIKRLTQQANAIRKTSQKEHDALERTIKRVTVREMAQDDITPKPPKEKSK